MITNPQDTAFSTSLSIDKICGVLVGSYDLSTYNSYYPDNVVYVKNFPHSFTRPVFCDALFSNTANGSFIPAGQQSSFPIDFNIFADSSNLYFASHNNSGTLYYKIICTWIDGFDNTNPLIAPVLETTSTAPYFDSRQNYQKVFKQDVITVGNPGVGNVGSTPIAHNLDYQPNFKIFFESNPGQVWGQINGGSQDPWALTYANSYECWAVADDNNLTLYWQGGSSSAANLRIWYRIYYDA